MKPLPTFREFFEALHHGRKPFPWQERLAEEVLGEGWPELLDLPTGAGKTSALEVALYCLCAAPERMPRRTLLVVDRRVVVDQGADHARDILHKLRSAENGPLKAVADALRGLFAAQADAPPFAVAVMRGGMPRDNDWASRPDQPVLGVSTVDQVGSRLLFRGYGVSPRSAPIHAGLIGNDTLILLDEVHLAVPFAQTLAMIQRSFRHRIDGLPSRFSVVQMSATPGRGTPIQRVFGLAADDRADPVLQPRLTASKRATLMLVKVAGGDESKKQATLAQRAVKEAVSLVEAGASVVGIVLNRVDTARMALRALQAIGDTGLDAMLVTGRMRPLDRDHLVRTRLLPRAGGNRQRTEPAQPFVVVSTQCIEAGADLDFDGLVTECASLDALRQRFGRVDRRGALGRSQSVVLGRSDLVAGKTDDPVYGGALAATWQWLNSIATDGVVDFSIAELPRPQHPDGSAREDLIPRPLDAPVLMPVHLDSWVQTTPRPSPDQDIALWLHGPKKDPAEVQIIWRVGVPAETKKTEAFLERLSACRPSSLEAVTVPLGAARRWLAGLPVETAIADVVGATSEEGQEREERRKDRTDSSAPVALRWDGDSVELVSADKIRPGDVLVIDTQRGGLHCASFDPDSTAPVTDLGDLAQLRGRGIATLRLSHEALVAWSLPPAMLSEIPTPAPDESLAELRSRVMDWLADMPSSAPPEWFVGTEREWKAARRALTSARARVLVVDGEVLIRAPASRADLQTDPEASEALTEDDDSSFRQVEVTLAAHSKEVEQLAGQFGQTIGLSKELTADLALAAWLHDVGKADPRFQRWMVGGSEVRASLLTEHLAKSALPPGSAAQRKQARVRSGYPDGCRHELLSLDMIGSSDDVLARAHDPALVLHLVASHHGWCRPFPPAIQDDEQLEVRLQHGEAQLVGATSHQLAQLDSGIADRFWDLVQRYGWWGLAWLEAILRLADHRASERESEA
jgi:CRISPR-associated endonuclease/helicase Cas3